MKHTIVTLALLVMALMTLSACGDPDDTVVRIGKLIISVSDYESRVTELRKTGYSHITELTQEARLELLDGIVTRELLVLEGLRRGLERDPTIALELLKTRQRALMNKLYNEEGVKAEYASFTDEELREFFIDRQYDIEVFSRHIVCQTVEEARQVLDALAAGTPFGTLVSLHSLRGIQDRFGPQGWVGWFKLGELYDELVEPLSTMSPGETYPEPVETSLGYHVFGLKARRPVEFETAREWLENALRTQRRADDMEEYVGELRQRYNLVAYRQVFAALRAIGPDTPPPPAAADQILFTWRGGQLTVADFAAQLQVGRVGNPALLDSAALDKAVDNLAGRRIMMAEAHRLGFDHDAEIRAKVEARRAELLVKWLFRAETLRGAFSERDVRAFYEQNLGMFTRDDGVVTEFSFIRRSIRTLLQDRAETEAMDGFIAELHETYEDQIHIYPEVLARAFSEARTDSSQTRGF